MRLTSSVLILCLSLLAYSQPPGDEKDILVGHVEALLKCSGWLSFEDIWLKHWYCESDETYQGSLKRLLAVDANNQLVNRNNVDSKLHQISTIISCKYADVLDQYLDIAIDVLKNCLTIKGLKNCCIVVLSKLKPGKTMFEYMEGVMSYLVSLNEELNLPNINNVTRHLKRRLQQITASNPCLTFDDNGCQQTDLLVRKIKELQRLFKLMSDKLMQFTRENCQQVPDSELTKPTIQPHSRTTKLNKIAEPFKASFVKYLCSLLNDIQVDIIKDAYTNLGFVYDELNGITIFVNNQNPAQLPDTTMHL